MQTGIEFHNGRAKKIKTKTQPLTTGQLTDNELIHLYLFKGENKWIEALFNRHIRFVIAVCMKYLQNEELAKDTAMQVFEKAIEDLPRFEIQNFKSWIYKVSRNACMMHFRTDKSTLTISLDYEKTSPSLMETAAAWHPTEEEGLNGELRLEQLEVALGQLEQAQKTCIEMFYLNGKSYKEVEDATGFTTKQVKSYIQNGKRNLKKHLLNKENLELLIFLIILTGNK